jgi:hypothetical protein
LLSDISVTLVAKCQPKDHPRVHSLRAFLSRLQKRNKNNLQTNKRARKKLNVTLERKSILKAAKQAGLDDVFEQLSRRASSFFYQVKLEEEEALTALLELPTGQVLKAIKAERKAPKEKSEEDLEEDEINNHDQAKLTEWKQRFPAHAPRRFAATLLMLARFPKAWFDDAFGIIQFEIQNIALPQREESIVNLSTAAATELGDWGVAMVGVQKLKCSFEVDLAVLCSNIVMFFLLLLLLSYVCFILFATLGKLRYISRRAVRQTSCLQASLPTSGRTSLLPPRPFARPTPARRIHRQADGEAPRMHRNA